MKKVSKLTNEIYKPTIVRRILSALLDLFFLILLFLSLNQFVVTPIFEKGTSLSNDVITYRQRLVDSNLYVVDNSTSTPYKITDLEKKLSKTEYKDKLDENIQKFYDEFSNEQINIEKYNSSKENSSYFQFSNGKYIEKDVVSIDTYIEFYEKEYENALNLLSQHDEIVFNLSLRINKFFVSIVSISLVCSLFILYLIIPLIFKDGETLGKKMMGIGVVNMKNGFRIKLSQKFVRFAVFLLLEVVLSILLLGIPLIISISMMFFSKNNLSLHDQLAATLCIDKKLTLVYKDIDEFRKHEEILLNGK